MIKLKKVDNMIEAKNSETFTFAIENTKNEDVYVSLSYASSDETREYDITFITDTDYEYADGVHKVLVPANGEATVNVNLTILDDITYPVEIFFQVEEI